MTTQVSQATLSAAAAATLPRRMTKIGSLVLVPDEWFARELGISPQEFRTLAKHQLYVPAIVVGTQYFYNLDFVEAALWLASRPGNPNFYGPGTSYREKVCKNTDTGRVNLDGLWNDATLAELATLMEHARRRNDGNTTARVVERLREAAARRKTTA